jgi:hypothetical protein
MNKTKRLSKKREESAPTVSAKYIFLDVVGFSHQRSIEAQSEIVAALNSIVHASLKTMKQENRTSSYG